MPVINGKIGDLTLTIVEGKNFCSKSTYCLIKIRSPSALSEKTTPSLNTSTPKWNESFTLPITIAEKEVKILVHLTKRPNFCIGEIIIPIEGLKNLESTEIERWWPIKQTSHVQLQGELFVSLKYHPLNDKNIDDEAMFNQTQVTLFRSIQSGALSTFETMERAILDERGILDNEYKRVSKVHGSDSATANTVNSMRQSLENKSKSLRLFTIDDIDQSLIEKFEKLVERKLEMPPPVEEKDPLLADNPAQMIRNIFTYSKTKQLEIIESLEEKFLIDSEKRNFITSGGVISLFKIIEENADLNLRLKTLGLLQELTYFISTRMNKESLLVLIVETISSFRTNENPDTILLCSSIIANAALSKDNSVQEYFSNGKGNELLIWMLDSNLESVNIRGLWAISCMPPEGKGDLINSIHDVLLAFLSSDNVDLLKWTTSVLSNLTYCEQNHLFFNFSLILPLLIKLLSNLDNRVVFESLRTLTNICINQNVKNHLTKVDDIAQIIQLTSSRDSDVQMQAAWVLGNFAIDEKSIVTLKNANAIEKLLELLNSDAGDESKRKATWALQNLLSEEGSRENFLKVNGTDTIVKLLQNSGELLIKELLRLSMYLCNFPNFLSALESLKFYELLSTLLSKSFSDSIKEQICWIIAKVADKKYQGLFREVGILSVLVEIVEEGICSKRAAIWALFNLAVGSEENTNILKKVAIEPLVKCMQDKQLRDITAKTLSLLATDENEKHQIVDLVSRSVKTLKISYSK